jgi:hypothetical protein
MFLPEEVGSDGGSDPVNYASSMPADSTARDRHKLNAKKTVMAIPGIKDVARMLAGAAMVAQVVSTPLAFVAKIEW